MPVVALAPWVGRRAAEIQRWLARPPLWEEPCLHALDRLGRDEVGHVLDRLGDMRFRQKVASFARALGEQDGEEILYRGLLEGLGYARNREPFLLLAGRLPWRDLRQRLLAVPPSRRRLLALSLLKEAAAGLLWLATGVRPENQPARRLEGAAALAARYAETGLAAGLSAAVLAGRPGELLAALAFTEGPRAVVGRARAGELAVNVVLPWAVARGEAAGDRPLALGAEWLYRRFPRPSPLGPTRHLDRAVGGRDGVTVDARRQQGMLYLYRQYCTQGGCGRCPLS